MMKKILLGMVFTAVLAVLVWGGVNRTLAKAPEADSAGSGRSAEVMGNGNSQRAATSASAQHDVNANAGQTGVGVETNPGIASNPQGSQGQAGNGRWGSSTTRGQGTGMDPLTEAEIQALYMALDDEYHALAVYQLVIDTFGEVEPFVEIALSEQNHIAALSNQFAKYDLPLPENPWPGTLEPFESVSAACQAGVDAEIANADLYAQLLSMTDDPALIRVFTNLSTASMQSHLPAFEDCQ